MQNILKHWVKQSCLWFVKTETHRPEISGRIHNNKTFLWKQDFTHRLLVQYMHQFFFLVLYETPGSGNIWQPKFALTNFSLPFLSNTINDENFSQLYSTKAVSQRVNGSTHPSHRIIWPWWNFKLGSLLQVCKRHSCVG